MEDSTDYLEINGARLGFRVRGDRTKPPLVFAHGYAMRGTGDLCAGLLDRLTESFAVHALDLRGQGASAAATEHWSFEAVADDLAAFSRARGFNRPVFVGHSFGAVIGLLTELRHPGLFASLCLLSPGPADHRRDPVETLDALIEHGQDREAMRKGFEAMFVHGRCAALEQVLDAVTLVSPEVHRAQKDQSPHFSIDDCLGEVAAPVLLVCGEADNVVKPDRQHDMARKLPRCKEVVFSGEGHMLAIEQSDTAAREVLAFVAETGLAT